MAEEKLDRRIVRTKENLHQALFFLLTEEGNLSKISVTELTERAKINRGTFYLYYKDVFEMVTEVENNLLDVFSSMSKEYLRELPTLSNTEHFLSHIFQFVEENNRIIQVLLSPSGGYSFLDRLKERIEQEYKVLFAHIPFLANPYFFSFSISGCVGVVQEWLKKGMDLSPKEMGEITLRLLQTGTEPPEFFGKGKPL